MFILILLLLLPHAVRGEILDEIVNVQRHLSMKET